MAKEHFERHKQPWKAEEAGQLRVLAGKGKGLKEIAKAIGRSEESTKDFAKKNGIEILAIHVRVGARGRSKILGRIGRGILRLEIHDEADLRIDVVGQAREEQAGAELVHIDLPELEPLRLLNRIIRWPKRFPAPAHFTPGTERPRWRRRRYPHPVKTCMKRWNRSLAFPAAAPKARRPSRAPGRARAPRPRAPGRHAPARPSSSGSPGADDATA